MDALGPILEYERIILKSPQEIKKMRRSNLIVAEILEEMKLAA